VAAARGTACLESRFSYLRAVRQSVRLIPLSLRLIPLSHQIRPPTPCCNFNFRLDPRKLPTNNKSEFRSPAAKLTQPSADPYELNRREDPRPARLQSSR
jgi:hypothetical protein